ncbi:MAG TPA: glycine betaine ABC transporter substrate-binding protein [Bryobacteraceae bacterium]|nr:glycine betaine ABC transporter substrate-binding protein [Bryobacteraceae bacterium]
MDRTALLCGLSAALLLAGCTRSHHLVVGSKNFTEQLVLGEIIAQHIEDRLHQPVDRKLDLGGTLLAHQALLAKDIDMYPEYTGTAFTNVLKLTGVNDPAVVLQRVQTEYAARFHVDWLDPLGFDSSFAMTVRGSDARSRHLATLSDAAADRNGFALGAGYEFLTRPDGLAALNSAYSIHWTAPPKSMDLGLLYQALTAKQVSMAAANTTDGLLSKLDVKVLADDKHAFPPYQACIAVRSDTLTAYPGLRAALTELSGKISAAAMQKMNYAVDVEHRPVPDVAKEFLRTAGLR